MRKTLEFKLDLNQTQQTTVDRWLDDLRWVWNQGLSLLEEDQQRRWRVKNGFEPLDGFEKWEFYRNPQKWDWQAEGEKSSFANVYGLCCSVTHYDRRTQQHRPVCNIREHTHIEDARKQVGKVPTNKANPNKEWLHSICSRFRNGVIDDLQTAWKAYTDPKNSARRPKYKGKNNRLKSLKNMNAHDTCRLVGNHKIQMPVLGIVKAKGIRIRLGESRFTQVRILKEGSRYYLQVTIEGSTQYDAPKYPDDAVGLDPGVVYAVARSDGWVAKNHRYYRKAEKRLARLQRKASRQQPGSNNQKKQFGKIANLHAKIKRARRANNHRISTTLVQTFGGIAIEENKFSNMVKRPKPKQREDGKGWEQNKAKAKAGLNKSLLDVGGYQLRNMIEGKAKQHCEFHAVSAPYNSQTCAKCGTIDKNSRTTQSEFICVACGHSENADTNASQVTVMKAEWTRKFHFRMRESVDVKASETKDTPLSRGNRKGKTLTKPAFECETHCQQELAASDARSAQAGIPEITGKSLSKTSSNKPVPNRSKRSAQTNPQIYIQLPLWDATGETDLKSG